MNNVPLSFVFGQAEMRSGIREIKGPQYWEEKRQSSLIWRLRYNRGGVSLQGLECLWSPVSQKLDCQPRLKLLAAASTKFVL